MAAHDESKPDMVLNSPVGGKPAVYKWPLTYVTKGQKIDGAEEIIETIRWVAHEFQEFKPAIENLLPEQLNTRSYEDIKALCDKYNKITDFVMRMNKGTSVALKTSSRASQGLLKHILEQVYNYAVVEPTELNKYSPFSSETYGETSFEFMAQLIDRNQFKPREQDIFIDLGSGVGHIVLQMAATVKCKKCYGIEISGVPAGYAKLMEERFKFWMNWYGKTYTEFELLHGDFFEKKYADIIKNATYILVNNFAFKPDVDHKLKQRFLDLKDGTQILSSKPFCSLKSRVNERNLTDIGSIMHVVEIQPDLKKDSVSWTPKPLPYYLHVLDGSRVERYYERQKRRQGRSLSDKGRPTKRQKTGKHSDSYSDDSDDNTVYGPTTRKAWSEWCNSSSMHASNRASTDSSKTLSSRNNSTDTENLYEGAIKEETLSIKPKETDSHKKEKKIDTKVTTNSERVTAPPQETSAQAKNGYSTNQPPKSCLDKKRDYAIKKGGSNSLQSAPPSTLYSITKTADTSNGASSANKIPSLIIKVKPPVEAEVFNDSTISTIRTKSESKSKEARDENGKKLRQRKKPAAQLESPPSSSKSSTSSKIESKISIQANIDSILATSSNASRGKKVTATKASSKSGNTKKKSNSSPDKNYSLALLHAKTIESVSGNASNYSQPAPGCTDHNLSSITDTPSLPRVVIKDMSMFISEILSPKNIEKFMTSTKLELEKFAQRLRNPGTRESLLRGIEQERENNHKLLLREHALIREIELLASRLPGVMKSHCDDFGLMNTEKSIVEHIGCLLKEHEQLSHTQTHLESSVQNALCRSYMSPPVAHSSSAKSLPSPYAIATSSATLDLSLKPIA